MNPDLQLIAATGKDAQRLRDNPVWRNVLNSLHANVEQRELACPTYDKELAADVIRVKQLLAGIDREITRMINDGEAAEHAQLLELEREERNAERENRPFTRD